MLGGQGAFGVSRGLVRVHNLRRAGSHLHCDSAAGLKRLSEAEHAHGVSIMNVLVMVAGAFGTSLYGGVAQAGMGGAAARGLSESVAQGIGFSDAMIVGTAFAVIALALSFAFRKRRRERDS